MERERTYHYFEVMDQVENRRIIIASNRLPLVIEDQVKPASGGLVTALVPILKEAKGVWIGWPGAIQCSEERVSTLLKQHGDEAGYSLIPLFLSAEEARLYYDGFSNEIIWPLFHDLHTTCNFSPEYWEGYQAVNRKFANELLAFNDPQDFIWVQDYHLMLVARELRDIGVERELSFFLHIPFASVDIFSKIPWRYELVEALLQFDHIGFQTERDSLNFVQCVEALVEDAVVTEEGKGAFLCSYRGREAHVNAFPISIDYAEFDSAARSSPIIHEIAHIQEQLPNRKIIISIDRLDYTKGLIYRLQAIRHFLHSHPEMHQQVNFVQQMVPSRTHIPEYLDLKEEVDKIVSEINSEFTTLGWVPIHYMFHSLARDQLLAYYRYADALLVTSVKDGMNLVAKEFVACNVDNKGVLVLSEFAGAACQLGHSALLINPYDVEAVANAIYHALMMDENERCQRMEQLRESVQSEDINKWIAAVINPVESSFVPK